jgi:cell division protein FtsL
MAEVLPWYPPVGVFIAILGLLGVAVPLVRDLAKIGKWEKAFWTIVMFVLMGLEIRSIYLDRKAHDIEQATARAEQLQHFKEIGDGIRQAIDDSQTQFNATMKRSDSILSGVGENIKIANGGDSYAYIQMSPVNGGFELYVIQDETTICLMQ